MPKAAIRKIPWVAAGALIVLSGCYTVIMHPKVENERRSADQLRVQCVDCHKDYHVYPYDPYNSFFGADYYWTNPHYGYYYGYPWWWNDYYWDYYYNPQDPSAYPGDSRDVARPAYHGGAPVRTGDAAPPSLSTGVTRQGQITAPSSQGTTTPGGDTTVTTPDSRVLSPGQRISGQPPWNTLKGEGAKPPSLREGVTDEPVVVPTDTKSTTTSPSTSPTNTASPQAKPAKNSSPPENKSEPEKKEEPKTRARPKRNPG